MAQVITPISDDRPEPGLVRREEIALAFFGTWMASGLYLDGWAHIHSKPETFFTPWHGVLYSGFAAAVAFFMLDRYRHPERTQRPTDRIAVVGLFVFMAAALGDFAWHSIFGIEVDLEALLSPTHLGLLGGGVAMVSAPLRSAWVRPDDGRPSFRAFFPTLASVTLATAASSFFLQYLSAFRFGGLFVDDGPIRFLEETHGLAAVLTTNVLLLVPTLLILKRWRPPAGTFTVLYTSIALGMVGSNFRFWPLMIVPGFVGGVAADVTVRRTSDASPARTARWIGVVVPFLMWSSWFVALQATRGVHWPAELIAGAVILAVFCGVVLSLLAVSGRTQAP